MAQHDLVVDNSTGQAVRQDMNAALQALVTLSSGPVEPATKYPYQLWYNTSTAKLMQRNGGNNAWVEFVTSLGGLAPLASPVFTGNPTISASPPANDNDLSIPTTAWVQTEIAGFAPLASPAFTGTVTAPTPAVGTNSTVVATTAFVKAQGYLAGGDVPTNSRMYARSDSAWALMALSSFRIVERVYGSGTTAWAKPAAAEFMGIVLEMQGAGGGGGGTATPSAGYCSAGGGGGSGARMRQWIPAASLPASANVVIGAGGAGGTAGGGTGGAGGNTTFSTWQCSGGAGGVSRTYASQGAAYGGGPGGTTGWNFSAYGDAGGEGVCFVHGSTMSQGGKGASSAYGVGGIAIFTGTSLPGDAASGYGSGGGGSMAQAGYGGQAGAAGRGGLVRISEYYGSY